MQEELKAKGSRNKEVSLHPPMKHSAAKKVNESAINLGGVTFLRLGRPRFGSSSQMFDKFCTQNRKQI